MTIEEQTMQVIIEQLRLAPGKAARDAEFAHLGVDSLDLAELFMRLEETFEIEMANDVRESLPSIGTTIDFVVRAISSRDCGAK